MNAVEVAFMGCTCFVLLYPFRRKGSDTVGHSGRRCRSRSVFDIRHEGFCVALKRRKNLPATAYVEITR